MRALVIIDMQNDFMPWGSLPVNGGDAIIPLINRLTDHFQHVYATMDWHPPDHVSFALNHGKRPGEQLEIGHRKIALWPIHCVQGSLGAELVSPLKKEKIEKIFHKGIDPLDDSYGVFFDEEKKRSTGLYEYLKKKRIKELYFTGVATEYCVKYSVCSALELGFSATVILDACRGVHLKPGDEADAIKEMQAKGAAIVTSQNLLKTH